LRRAKEGDFQRLMNEKRLEEKLKEAEVDVACVSFRSSEKGKLQGFADLVIEPLGIRLYSCEPFRSVTEEWVNFPSRPYESRDGEKKFARMVDFTTVAGYKAFEPAALVAIRQFCEQSNERAELIRSGAGE
jgi:hypothetical protein